MRTFLLLVSFFFVSKLNSQTNTFPTSGNVGIGTLTPNAPLQVLGNPGDITSWGLMSFDTNTGNGDRGVKIGAINNSYGFIQAKKTGQTNDADLILNPGGGNVGIGVISPDSKLSVKGGIESEQIRVISNVADYVFKPEYKLMSLEELEQFIQKNGHLPNIQNEKDVSLNKGFVNLGELTISLMEKVEELTIHIISLNKRIKELEDLKVLEQEKKLTN